VVKQFYEMNNTRQFVGGVVQMRDSISTSNIQSKSDHYGTVVKSI